MRNFQKNMILPKNQLRSSCGTRVVFNKKKNYLAFFSSKGSFLGDVGKNLIFKDRPNIYIYSIYRAFSTPNRTV